jgi:hypothetical protein
MTRLLLAATMLLAAGCSAVPTTPPGEGPLEAQVTIDISRRYQRFNGWGGEIPNFHWNGGDPPQYQGPDVPIPERVRHEVADRVVNDLGMTNFGVTLFSGLIEPTNDNDDPFTTREAGFDFSAVDPYLREVVPLLRERVRARGEPWVLSVKVITAAPRGLGPIALHRANAEEYAEFAVTVLRRFRQFGVEVDYWVIENEPDLHAGWTPARLGQFIVTIGRRMRAAGFRTRFTTPETSRPGNLPLWLSGALHTPDALPYIAQISYHSYDYDPTIGQAPPAATRIAISHWGRQYGLSVAQTEQSTWERANPRDWGHDRYEQSLDIAEQIHADLTQAQADEWWLYLAWGQQLSGSGSGGGAPLLLTADFQSYFLPKFYWGLRQFMRYVRPGDARIAAVVKGSAPVQAVAFVNPAGKPVIVLFSRAKRPVQIWLRGCPPGTYSFTFSNHDNDGAEMPPQTVQEGAGLALLMPAETILTISMK